MLPNSRVRWVAAGLAIVLAGCASTPPRGVPGPAPNYAGWTCGDLAKEAKRLARRTTGTQEFLLPHGRKDAEEQRTRDKQNLKAVKRAAIVERCDAVR